MKLEFNANTLLKDLENYIGTKTVFGEPMIFGSISVVPIIKVSFGLGLGGGTDKDNQGNGGGAGARLVPMAVMVIKDDDVSVLPISNSRPGFFATLADSMPEMSNKWAENMSEIAKKAMEAHKKKDKKVEEEPEVTPVVELEEGQ